MLLQDKEHNFADLVKFQRVLTHALLALNLLTAGFGGYHWCNTIIPTAPEAQATFHQSQIGITKSHEHIKYYVINTEVSYGQPNVVEV